MVWIEQTSQSCAPSKVASPAGLTRGAAIVMAARYSFTPRWHLTHLFGLFQLENSLPAGPLETHTQTHTHMETHTETHTYGCTCTHTHGDTYGDTHMETHTHNMNTHTHNMNVCQRMWWKQNNSAPISRSGLVKHAQMFSVPLLILRLRYFKYRNLNPS